jgi:hypothetical protein
MTRRQPLPPANPFRIGGIVTGDHFADRAEELRRIEQALLDPGDKLLVYGPRRMGKSSTLDRALARVNEREGAVAFRADLSGATTVTDIANRILQGATSALGRRWQEVVNRLVQALRINVTLQIDPSNGLPVLTLGAEGRAAPLPEQRVSLERVLAGLEQIAAERGLRIGVVLDEFQTIHRFGGEEAEWHFRGVIQTHQHVSYVAAGSDVTLLEAMQGTGRAFYQLFRPLYHGPIEPALFAAWIDARLIAVGVEPRGIGERIVATAGPRTRDIVELARAVYDVTAPESEVADATLDGAVRELLAMYGEQFRRLWDDLPGSQQNVLRAVAAGEPQLYGRSSQQLFGFRSSAEIAQAVRALADREVLALEAGGLVFDNPIMRAWVARYALPDVGILESTSDTVKRLQAGPPP